MIIYVKNGIYSFQGISKSFQKYLNHVLGNNRFQNTPVKCLEKCLDLNTAWELGKLSSQLKQQC